MKVHSAVSAVDHPLAMLTAAEAEAAVAILRREGRLGETVRIHSALLREPDKEAVLAYEPGQQIERRVAVVLRDRVRHVTYEALVSLTGDEVLSWRERTDVQPPITQVELNGCEATIKEDPTWQEAMRRRGYTDFPLAQIDPWPSGWFGPEDDPSGRRTMRGLTWVRRRDDRENGYARPVENLVVLFDLDEMKVLRVEDGPSVKIPEKSGNYGAADLVDPGNHPHIAEGPRTDLRPIDIVQPEGSSFTLTGNLIEWQRWRLRVGFTQREGLILQTVAYDDRGRWRPVLHRASLSEMYIPYGDPGLSQYRKNVFDMGEFGLGIWTNPLELGCDCLGEIRYLDGLVVNSAGEAVTIKNAICIHEEDDSILWKHLDFRTLDTEVRRSRRLVISSICTVGNYEYGFYWYLSQDGSIEYQIKLTGIISNGSVDDGVRPAHGRVVAPNVYGPNHQHFFNVRLDMTVDGVKNSVYEVEAVADPAGPDNPSGGCWRAVPTLIERESDAQRQINPLAGRHWRIVNPSEHNLYGEETAYALMPGDTVGPLMQPDAPGLKRAGYIAKQLWVTASDADQMHAAGAYPNQTAGGDGLPVWVQADRPLVDTDLVVWYTFGAHHVVRPEDWPVMPATKIGFMLKPSGFFDYNPAIDVAAPEACNRNGHQA
ncbi:MAG TPA: primary-amine oxidase [Candidatus Dormibacteraeota bacterium]|jgi:primary-amine oxidase|nr:primary-amine oxidase [Candidatus Dormibacteraeota bacterium]